MQSKDSKDETEMLKKHNFLLKKQIEMLTKNE